MNFILTETQKQVLRKKCCNFPANFVPVQTSNKKHKYIEFQHIVVCGLKYERIIQQMKYNPTVLKDNNDKKQNQTETLSSDPPLFLSTHSAAY
ncbi:hypothetical protein XENTR_v10021948 [Xenopus tropicalis]|nr:hypothetical protein XENTR_v10021948 [Xenopus tropicalis]